MRHGAGGTHDPDFAEACRRLEHAPAAGTGAADSRDASGSSSPSDPADPMICGQAIAGRRHMCAFVDSRQEQYDILMPFLRQGFAASDLIVSIVDEEHAEDHRCRCSRAGIDLAAHEASGRAQTFGFATTYLIDEHFSANRMLGLIDGILKDSRAKGIPRVRAFGEMHWALDKLPGTEELIEYESRLNDVCEQYPDPVICVYDVNRFPGRVLLDILATHPKVILGGRIVENPYYTPPREFLASYRKRRARAAASDRASASRA